ncbi:2-hydroxyacyl-CoA dehydratase [bacterium]|nr:2-hydroxyacyl-CoA dehydratase [bacterium]
MSTCCSESGRKQESKDAGKGPRAGGVPEQSREDLSADQVLEWFRKMVPNNLEYVRAEKEKGRGLVGIMCEYTPREVIMAAGAMPLCLCGGDVRMIPAAEEALPANLCPLIKSTYGYSVTGKNPFLSMLDLVVAETTCDGKKKMYELLSERHPMHVLELPQKPDKPEAADYWYGELVTLKRILEERFRTEICDERLEESIRLMNRERRLRRSLADLMTADDPPLTGLEILTLKSLVSGIPADFTVYEQAPAAFSGRMVPGGVRVLLTGVPVPHGAERVLGIIEANGGLIVAQENCTGMKPVDEDVPEGSGAPLRAIADTYYHLPCSVMTGNPGRLDLLRRLTERFRPECVIELVWQACLTYDVESVTIRRYAEAELGLPYLKIETDYSPSDTARIATRVQALCETVRGGA